MGNTGAMTRWQWRCPIKAISLWQPSASLIVIGAKRFETRSWATNYRGPILIHAAKKWTPDLRRMIREHPFTLALKGHVGDFKPGEFSRLSIPLGCILGVADLCGCFRSLGQLLSISPAILEDGTHIHQPELSFGDFYPGRFAWKLENVRRFETPIPFRGMQGIFNVPDAIVAEQLAKARAA